MTRCGKRGASLLLAAALTLGLSACGQDTASTKGFTERDAEVYIDGLIQENYLGQAVPDYLELVDIREEDVEELYDSVLDTDVEYFLYMYDIDYPTDELREEIKDLYREIYRYTKYDIVSAAAQEDGSFAVKLTVYPIDIVQTVNEHMNIATKEFYEKYPQEDLNSMRDEEYEKVDGEWARLILDLYQDALKEIGNMTEQSLTVQVEEGSDGLYAINSDDFARLDALIVDYTNMAAAE